MDKDFLMPIEDIFSISGRGTVVTGRIERGIVKVGDEMDRRHPRTQDDRRPGGDVPQAPRPGAGGRQRRHPLRGTKKDDVERGQVLANAGLDHATHQVKARCTPDQEEGGRHTPFSPATAAVLLPHPPTYRVAHLPRGRRG